jgi:hypothetical protein
MLVRANQATIAAALWAAAFFSGSVHGAPLAAPSLSPGVDIRQENGEVTVNGAPITVVRYTWRDSASRPRSVSLVPASPATSGYAVQMTYQVNDGVLRTVEINAAPVVNGDEGFGYFVSHELFRNFSDGGNNTIASRHAEDDSPLGRYLPSTGTASSVGRVQAVHEYRLNYPRWGTVAPVADPSQGVISANGADHQRFLLPVIIRWSFIAGQDYPLWSVDYDLSAATDRISTDVRAPYGVMSFNENNGPQVTALRWGDRYLFAADAGATDFGAAGVGGGLGWAWSTPNTGRRYNVLGSGNYEFGIVDTVAVSASRYADGYSDARTHASPVANCPYGMVSLPCDYEWAYQSFQYDYGPPARPKIAWGSAPFLGSSLTGAWNGVESEPLQGTGHISYATHIVFGRNGTGTPLTIARASAPMEPARKLYTLTLSGGGTVTYTLLGDTGGPYTQSGQSLAPWTSVRLVAVPSPGYEFLAWGIQCVDVTGPVCMIAMDGDRYVEAIFTQASDGLSLSPISILFDPQSVGTTSSPRMVTVTNTSASPVTIGPVSTDAQFSQTNDCATLAPGESCTVAVSFNPLGGAYAIGATVGVNGTLSVARNVGSTRTMALSGNAENSLVRHYYQAILNRAPDSPGLNYWQGEAARLASLGVDASEALFVMAGYFFNSAEYLAAGKGDAAFVTDLYNTFFNRAPDGSGLGFWVGQIQGGLPREVVLFSFMFSNEFRTFTQGIFGNTASRPEVNVVMDFFRGILNRIPDTASFQYWLGRMRAAQCAGAGPVYTEVDAISAAFIFNPEYNNRARNNTQFVTDMYYSFLRRGGDAGGVNFWINELNAGARDVNNVRINFLNSPEFGARVQAVINAGCYTGP